ncbi:MAG: iron ABC transporter permease [Phycisphaerales bacterium]|nr:iron ABC transporter permease [Phycisphaerales bacterium]
MTKSPGHQITRSLNLQMWSVWVLPAVAVFFLCMMVASEVKGVGFYWPAENVRQFRVDRVLGAAVVGFALAAAGVTLQALLRNPLADPYILGISSGSSVGVMAWLLLSVTWKGDGWIRWLLKQGQIGPAVAGAVITCLLVFALARPRKGSGGMDRLTLLLVGVVVSAINGAVLMVLNWLAPAGVKADLISYMMGSIEKNVTPLTFWLAVTVIVLGYLPILLSGRALNIGSLSDVEATSMGVNVAKLRTLCFISASVMTGAAIILSGPIGFVGLICPHITRGLVGADHRKLTVAAPFCGAIFLMLADTLVRGTSGCFSLGELPVGVVTALCGGPFFLILLHNRRGGGL